MGTTRRLATMGITLLLAAFAVRSAHAQGVGVSGLVYAQYDYQLADSANHANAFDVKRAYLTFTRSFDDNISTRITADVYRDANGSLNYRLKYAYVAWSPSGGPISLRFGQIHTPLLDWEEGLWGYRMQGTMPLERYGYVTSSDLGFGAIGSWKDQMVNAQVTLVNGEGYHGGVGDQHKDLGGRVSVRLIPTDDGGSRGGLRVTGLVQLGAYTGGGARNRLLAMLSYKSSMLTVAGEMARTTDGGPGGAPDVNGNVFSVYGALNVPESRWGVIGRIDVADPNTDVSNDGLTRFIGGVSYKLHPHLLLLADLDHVSYQETPTPAQHAASSTLLLQTQFTF
ncbi:MAG: hypothetical protein P8Z36_15450 [Gemmatimonadota bacterium]|jgi:hypothetical protein